MAKPDREIKPPGFPRYLLERLVPAQDRAVILGDMDEGYHQKWLASPKQAREWYWQQTLKSLPYLAWQRITSPHIKAITAILLATLVGYIFIHLWDIFAARKTAQVVARNNTDIPLEHVRKLYFLVYMLGAAIVGGIIASITFTPRRTFIVNSLLFLGPIMAVIFTDSLTRFLFADTPNALSYFLQRLGLSCPALIFGAFIGMRLTRTSDK